MNPDTGGFEYVISRRENLQIRSITFADSKIPGYVWTRLKSVVHNFENATERTRRRFNKPECIMISRFSRLVHCKSATRKIFEEPGLNISRNLGQAVNIRDNKGLFKSFVNNFLCYKFLL